MSKLTAKRNKAIIYYAEGRGYRLMLSDTMARLIYFRSKTGETVKVGLSTIEREYKQHLEELKSL